MSKDLHSLKFVILFQFFMMNMSWNVNSQLPNSWLSVPDYPGNGYQYLTAFRGIGSVYTGTGTTLNAPFASTDIWAFNFSTNQWTAKADYGGNPLGVV